MKKIKTAVYETDDGLLWKDKGQAKRHSAWLDLKNIAARLLHEMAMYDTEEQTHEKGGASDMAELIYKKADDLARIFRAEPCDGGGEPNGETRDACECGRAYIATDDIVCHLCLEENEQASDEPSPLDLSAGDDR